jgi:hypothetical protein
VKDLNTDRDLPTIGLLQEALILMFKTFPDQPFTNLEIEKFAIEQLGISEEAQRIPREKSRTELQYRLAWARTKAKGEGKITRNGKNSWISKL